MNKKIKILQDEAIEKKKIALHYNTRDHRFSSSGLRKEVADKENDKPILRALR